MDTLPNPIFTVFGIEFDATILLMSLLCVLIVFLFVFLTSRKMAMKPTGKQNVIEFVYEFVQNLIRPNLGDYTKNYSLFAFTIFLFILVANNIGLLTKLEAGGHNFWATPTATFAFNFGLSIMVTTMVHFEGIRKAGVKNYFKGYLAPVPFMLPMNIIGEFANLLSLALRLYGNIFSGDVVLWLLLQLANWSIFAAPVAFGLNMLWTAFSLFIGCIQAYVFTLLSTKYIGDKVQLGAEETD